jgi:hypothetical protein
MYRKLSEFRDEKYIVRIVGMTLQQLFNALLPVLNEILAYLRNANHLTNVI